MKRLLTIILGIGTLAVFSANAIAQQPVEYNVTVKADAVKGSPGDHFVTFDIPVEIPDRTLQPGTYVFRMMGSSAVQVSTADRSEQLAMFFTIPIRRLETSDAYQVTLLPAEKGGVRRIGAWFLPNRDTGLQFQYGAADVAAER